MATSQRDPHRHHNNLEESAAQTPEAGEPGGDTHEAEQANTNADTPDTNGADDLRSRFRAALERKRDEAKNRSARGHGTGTSRVGDVHRRAGGKRTFRRKSG
ncbi:MAG: DUF5302 domain-containing protein [Pseudonocardia sp.]|nr:DUF5302 domain-containing protein [Pseudonocardia sp.]MBO0877054.1 DUF5302 domain-containing protein [Pseudonocardia sp.]